MKEQEVVFTKPIEVLQVFRNIFLYRKNEKSFAHRKERMGWQDILSRSGYVLEDDLYLPEKILQNPDLTSCECITIEDNTLLHVTADEKLIHTDLVRTGIFETKYNNCLYLSGYNKFDIFKLSRNENLELLLEYKNINVGIPKRNNFKLCDLKQNHPVEIRINGKSDNSATRGQERVFKEQHYIIEYIGNFCKCKILKEPYPVRHKHPPENTKLIDLRKPLW
jgi:hypothetical protein